MNANRALLGVIGAMVIAGAAVLFETQRQAESKLRAQNQVLRQQLEESSQLAAENERQLNLARQTAPRQRLPESQWSELLRLRGEVGRLRQQAQEVEAMKESNRQALAAAQKSAVADKAREAASADFWLQDSWQFVGYATPEASLQSQFYTSGHGDLKQFLQNLTGEARKDMEKDLGRKTQAEVLANLRQEAEEINSIRVLGRESLPDGATALTVTVDAHNKKEDMRMVLRQVGNDWKISSVRPADRVIGIR